MPSCSKFCRKTYKYEGCEITLENWFVRMIFHNDKCTAFGFNKEISEERLKRKRRMMNSQGKILSKQTFQCDFLRQSVIFYFMTTFILEKFMPISYGKRLGRVVTWGNLYRWNFFYCKLLQHVMQRFSILNASAPTQEDFKKQTKVPWQSVIFLSSLDV